IAIDRGRERERVVALLLGVDVDHQRVVGARRPSRGEGDQERAAHEQRDDYLAVRLKHIPLLVRRFSRWIGTSSGVALRLAWSFLIAESASVAMSSSPLLLNEVFGIVPSPANTRHAMVSGPPVRASSGTVQSRSTHSRWKYGSPLVMLPRPS